MVDHTTRRLYSRFKGKQAKVPATYIPKIWVDGCDMFVTCDYLSVFKQDFTKLKETQFFKLVHIELRNVWDVDTRGLTIEWQPDQRHYRLNFNDDQEFIMMKLRHG